MPYKSEKEMYPHVCKWLKIFLKEHHKKHEIHVFDSSRKKLNKLIEEHDLIDNLPSEWTSWDIQIDIVGFATNENENILAFVECKNSAISLSYLSQLLGYSKVSRPTYSFIISPQGPSDSLKSLLLSYNRIDILEYHSEPGILPYSIIVAKWNERKNSIVTSSIITGIRNIIGHI